MELRREIFAAYVEEHDLTFVMEETTDNNGNLVSLENCGFYFGEPDTYLTEMFYRDYKGDFDTEGGTK